LKVNIDKIKKFAKEYNSLLVLILAILGVLGIFGFDFNIPAFWSQLPTEGKVLFMGFINFIWTTFVLVILLTRLNAIKGNN